MVIFLKTELARTDYMDFSDNYPIDARVTGAGVHVRKAPTIKSKVVTQLAFGTYAQLLARSDHSDSFRGKHAYYWLKVKLRSGQTGWIWGRYLVYYYPDQDVNAAMEYNGKAYELRVVEVEYPPYIDYANSKIDSEYGFGGTLMPFFMEKGDKYHLRFIRNNKIPSKSNALENYWKIPVACCGSDSHFGNIISTSDYLYLERIWETDGETEKILFKIEPAKEGNFTLKSKQILYKTNSKAVNWLIDKHIRDGCSDAKGWFAPDSLIEADLTNDGKKDFIISHYELNCENDSSLTRSNLCGFRACSVFFYVQKNGLLIEKEEILSIGVSIEAGDLPVIYLTSPDFVTEAVRWDGHSFR